MGIFFKRSLSNYSQTMIDYISNTDTTTTLVFDGEDALKQSDVFTATKILAGDIAASRFESDKDALVNPVIMDLLNKKPNNSMTPYSFKFAIVAQMLLTGNSFAVIQRSNAGLITGLEFAKPSQMVTYEDLETGEMSYEYTNKAGSSFKLTSADVLHFKYVTTNGKTGMSPLAALKTELSMLDNGNKMLSSFFKKGIQAGGILKLTKGNVNNAAKKQIKQDFEEVNSGASNANSVIVLDNTQEFSHFEINTDILKMIQNNVYSTKQIAKAFGIPLSRFGMELVNTKDDSANDVYVSSTLRMLAKMITDELYLKLGSSLSLDFSTLTGQDTASRMNKLMEEGNKGSGIATINEARSYYGLPPIDKGEQLVQLSKGGGRNGDGDSESNGGQISG